MRLHRLTATATADQHLLLHIQRHWTSEHQLRLCRVDRQNAVRSIVKQGDKYPTRTRVQGSSRSQQSRAGHAGCAAQYGHIAETAFVAGVRSVLPS